MGGSGSEAARLLAQADRLNRAVRPLYESAARLESALAPVLEQTARLQATFEQAVRMAVQMNSDVAAARILARQLSPPELCAAVRQVAYAANSAFAAGAGIQVRPEVGRRSAVLAVPVARPAPHELVEVDEVEYPRALPDLRRAAAQALARLATPAAGRVTAAILLSTLYVQIAPGPIREKVAALLVVCLATLLMPWPARDQPGQR